MTCKANIPPEMCDLWQETEAPECRGCEDNSVGFMSEVKDPGNGRYDLKELTLNAHNFTKGKTCKKEGCMRVGKLTRGYCSKHYSRLKKNTLGGPKKTDGRGKYKRVKKIKPECKYDGCTRPASSLEYCSMHYQQFKDGRLGKTFSTTCLYCDQPFKSKGLCEKHYYVVKYWWKKEIAKKKGASS